MSRVTCAMVSLCRARQEVRYSDIASLCYSIDSHGILFLPSKLYFTIGNKDSYSASVVGLERMPAPFRHSNSCRDNRRAYRQDGRTKRLICDQMRQFGRLPGFGFKIQSTKPVARPRHSRRIIDRPRSRPETGSNYSGGRFCLEIPTIYADHLTGSINS